MIRITIFVEQLYEEPTTPFPVVINKWKQFSIAGKIVSFPVFMFPMAFELLAVVALTLITIALVIFVPGLNLYYGIKVFTDEEYRENIFCIPLGVLSILAAVGEIVLLVIFIISKINGF